MLSCKLYPANLLKYTSKVGVRGDTHGSIRIQEGEPLRYKTANVVSGRFYYSARRHKRPQESQLRAGDPDLRLPHVDTLRKRLDMMPAIAALIGTHLASRLVCKFHDDIGSDLNGMSPAFAIHPQHIGTGGVTYRLELHQSTFQVLILRVGHPILNGRIEARKLAVGVGGLALELGNPIHVPVALRLSPFQQGRKNLV